jgi:hypothetical protein
METKYCTQCHEPKQESEFRAFVRNGKPRRYAECIPCLRARQRGIYARLHSPKALAPSLTPDPTSRLNQVTALWHGPVNRTEPLRWAA